MKKQISGHQLNGVERKFCQSIRRVASSPMMYKVDNNGINFCHAGPCIMESMSYQLWTTDNDIRSLFHFDSSCGMVTFLVCSFSTLLITCAIITSKAVSRNEKISEGLREEAEKKVPKRESVLDIRPGYNCIHKHLKQTDVFQERSKKTLWKDQLELEIMNSRISCIGKLLQPEVSESQWRKSRLPKVFCRNAKPVTA